ncbi:MAG TPA: hypothetical protein VE093_30910 [Polyangiaceae bacterium]|jgi:hypothetical protein|nr:hypothetical protein [Polyangiaceae bacterium]
MNFTPVQILLVVLGVAFYGAVLYVIDRSIASDRPRVVFRYVAAVATGLLFFAGVSRYVPAYDRSVDVVKAMIALTAAGCVFYEAHRAGVKRPVSERWKRFVGMTLAVAALCAYWNGFKIGSPDYYHRHELFHYYLGAKYFKELGYSGLYKCTAIAQDELGVVTYQHPGALRASRIDMSAEVRHPDRKIRNLSGDNLLVPALTVLDKPEECRAKFLPEQWARFKEDVKFFRTSSDKGYWEGMQKDHGYNPPPVWTIAGHYLSEIAPPTTFAMQALAAVDVAYLFGVFAALWWAFGWRVSAVAAIFWGCQSSSPFFWTGGAFLRQDWLFFLVLSACLARKRYFALSGASLVYAGLLRIFPGLVVIGWLVVAGAYLVKHRRMARHHVRMLIGGVAAACVLIPLSLHVSGKDAYQSFYHHTIQVHDQTPLTNHMGLRVLIAQKTPFEINEPTLKLGSSEIKLPIRVGVGGSSGRMKYTQDGKLRDPFEVWKRMRNERYAKYRYAAYAIIALSFAFFVYVVRRVRSMWIAECLAQIWIILLSQLTCYYYSFMILVAPLTKVKRGIEAPLFGLSALSQFVWMAFNFNDDKYWVLTLISLVFCYGLLCAFAPRELGMTLRGLLGRKDPGEPAPASPGAARGSAE